ncbi:hypothetical protein ACQ4PT_069518 [Festuca glaucescens]
MAATAVIMPHLDDGVVSEILYRVPSMDAYRMAAVCRQWRAVLCQPTFLYRHLSPLPLLDDRPYALIIQPQQGTRFTHLTIVAVDPADRVPVSVPVQPEYRDPKPPPTSNLILKRTPPLFDIAKENSVFRVLDPEGADEVDDHDVPAELPANGLISSDLTSATTMMEVSTIEEATPPSPLEDYVVFFERSVPMLDISLVASHGRLLLCRSRSRHYVCDPAANRWLALPPSTISPQKENRVLVETFSSATGRWDQRELPTHGAVDCLPAASPGIHVGTCFYWLTRHWGRILRYDAAQFHASFLREPPLAENAKSRVKRSLGSVDGRLRLCAFDIRDKNESNDYYMEGVHGVWLMDDSSSAWRRVHEATVEDVLAHYFRTELIVFEEEITPVDFAGACGKSHYLPRAY